MAGAISVDACPALCHGLWVGINSLVSIFDIDMESIVLDRASIYHVTIRAVQERIR